MSDTIISITAIVTTGVVTIVVARYIMICIQRKKMQSVNAPLPTTSSNILVAPHASSLSNSIVNSRDASTLSMDSLKESINRFLDDILKEKPMRFSPEHLQEFTRNYSERLGAGGFGVVYKGFFPTGVKVAVKVLSGSMDKRAEEQFMAEVGTIGRTYHINLVRLYGFCFDATLKAVVYEYMENGSLDRYLFDKNFRIEFGKLQEIAIGTAKGIRYLHEECQHKIIHYDIKPGNVLLTSNFTPKVGDFGLAKLCNRENSHITLTGARGTPGYAAPELWMPLPVTQKCDVYSYGMLLFEILGRRRNLEFEHTESQEWFPKWVWQKFEQGQLEFVLTLCGIERKDREKAERMFKVALWCVQYQPEARPSMSSAVMMLEVEEEIATPVNPFAYLAPDLAYSTLGSESVSSSTGSAAAENETARSSSSPMRK